MRLEKKCNTKLWLYTMYSMQFERITIDLTIFEANVDNFSESSSYFSSAET